MIPVLWVPLPYARLCMTSSQSSSPSSVRSALKYWEWFLVNWLTSSTIDAWIHPRIGGIFSVHALTTLAKADALEMSHGGATTCTPLDSSSAMNFLANELCVPERLSRIKLRAPRFTSQWTMLRPNPPKPPEMTYVASGGKGVFGFRSRTVYQSQI